MLKRDITYEDFDGKQVTETFYFNLSKSELVKMEYSEEGGFGEYLQKVVKAGDSKAILQLFDRIVLDAYGEKSEDGKRFNKSAELSEAFLRSAAYDALFMQLAEDSDAAAKFIQDILPKDLGDEVNAQMPIRPPVTIIPGTPAAPLPVPPPPTS